MKKLFRRFQTCLLALLIPFFYSSIANSQSLIYLDDNNSGNCYDIEVLESTPYSYRASVQIHYLCDTEVSHEGQSYHNISFGDEPFSDLYGKPLLPKISQSIYVPTGATLNVSVEEGIWKELSIGTIYPMQKNLLDSGYDNEEFVIERSVYESDLYTPQMISISDIMTYLQLQNAYVDICPFKYYPKDNKLSVLSNFIIQVTFNHLSNSWMEKSSIPLGKDNYNSIGKTFANANILLQEFSDRKIHESVADNTYNYLVIVGDIAGAMHSNALREFKKWKSFKGIKTKFVSTSTTGTTCDEIKNYIVQEYSRIGSDLSYVLLVGDIDKIPAKILPYYKWSTDTTFSDSWYGCMDGPNDVQMDVAIGRFSTNDTLEIQNMVDKARMYESGGYSYYGGNALLIANAENAPGQFQACMETIRTTTYNTPYSFDKLYGASIANGGDNATNSDVTSTINGGYSIVNYRGHGVPNDWPFWNAQNEWFHSDQINNLCDSVCSVFLCVACQLSNIRDFTTCMMEVFTRSEHGAAAFLGATLDTERSSNNTFNKTMYKALLNDSIVHIGLTIREACKSIVAGYYGQLNAFRYLLGGDPSLEIWTATPSKLSNIALTTSSNYISISTSGIDDCRIAIVSADGELTDLVQSNNSNFIYPIPLENCYFVINKHDYIPYIIKYDVSSSYIQNEIIDYDAYYTNTPLSIGYNVDSGHPYGNVIVKAGHTLSIKRNAEIILNGGFSVEKGATLVIQ